MPETKISMKKSTWILSLVLAITGFMGYAQKPISELTMVYDITVETNSDKPQMANMFNGATTTIYLKGASNRTEAVTSLGTSTTIYDGKTKSAVVLKEYGNQKLLVRMTAQNWLDANKKYEGIVFTKTEETKTIAGYNCTKSTGKLQDGTDIIIYTTKEIVPESKDYNNNQFKNAEGLVLEFQFSVSGTKITNTASKVIIGVVSNAKFDIPKTGYREMTYEESKAK
jgi:GLPGLI family protein